MANRIKPLRRVGSTGQPNIANMQEGEIAVNSYDQKIWMRVGSNLVEIANASTPSWGDISGKPATATRWPSWGEVTGKPAIPQGTVTSVTGGNGLSGSVTSSGSISLGTPGTLSGSTTNAVQTSSHTHALSTNLSAWDGYHPDNAFVDKGTIPGSVDLNTYRTTGIYHQNANADASSGTNYPANVAGMLTVFESGSMTYQTYQVYNTGDVYTRSRYNTTWSAWKLSVDGTTTITAGNGLTGGGTLAANRTITLGTPGTITATSTNSVSSTGHTHNLDTTGNFTWTGNHTFIGDAIARSSSASRQLTVERTGSSINAAVAYTTTGDTTVYAGQGDSGFFSWGTNTDIRWSHASTWGRIGADGLQVKGKVEASGIVSSSNAYIRGGSSAAIFSFNGTTTGSTIYFRPRGDASSTNQTVIDWDGSMTVGGSISDSIGNVRKPDFRTANGTITLASSDVNRIVEKSNNSSYTYTIPSGHGSHGDIITFVNSGTSGNLTINRATGVTLYRNGTNANIIVSPGSTVTIYRSATANRWIA